MGRGSRNGVKCCPRGTSSSHSPSSSYSQSEPSEGSITSTSSDSIDFANCQNCGPGGTQPPYAWLLEFPGMKNRSAGPVNCDDCTIVKFSTIVYFNTMVRLPGINAECVGSTNLGNFISVCSYNTRRTCNDRSPLCQKTDGGITRYLSFDAASLELNVNDITLNLENVRAIFRFAAWADPNTKCSFSSPIDICNPCALYIFNNTGHVKNCHDSFIIPYNSGNPDNAGEDPCTFTGGSQATSLCWFDSTLSVLATPLF